MAKVLTNLAKDVRAGNLRAFEEFWIEGGTEEGDAEIIALRELTILRYFYREKNVQ